MKKYLKIIIYLASFILLIVLANIGYNYLTKSYYPEKEIDTESQQNYLRKAEDFEVLNSENQKVRLSDFYGRPIVVNFWATWCAPCRTELPEFEGAYKKYNKEIEFLMVNLTDGYSDTIDSVKEFVKDNNYEFPVYFDNEYSASNAYGIYSIPQTLFIDEDGNIVNSYTGMMNMQTLENYIEKLL